MKIRTSFVSNSSSASFIITIEKTDISHIKKQVKLYKHVVKRNIEKNLNTYTDVVTKLEKEGPKDETFKIIAKNYKEGIKYHRKLLKDIGKKHVLDILKDLNKFSIKEVGKDVVIEQDTIMFNDFDSSLVSPVKEIILQSISDGHNVKIKVIDEET